MMWGYGGYGFGGGMGIGTLLFWGLIIFAVVMLFRGFSFRSNSVASGTRVQGKTALDLLGERYARGEIGKAEFEQKRNDLRGAGTVSGEPSRGVHEAGAAEAS